MSANGISTIFSELSIDNTVMDNSLNPHNNTKSFIENIEAGFINMNYQSKTVIKNSLVQGFRALQTSFLLSTG